MTPEKKVLKSLTSFLEKLKKEGHPVWWVKNHGSIYAKAGVPDLHITYFGRSVWIEVKSATGKTTEIQEHILTQIARAGGTVGIVRSVDELQAILNEVPR